MSSGGASGGSTSGGQASGGASSGGASNGGSNSGGSTGSTTGGSASGGRASGGATSGGNSSGGSSSGGSNSGGAASGGRASGGAASGGAASGGAASGGAASGGAASGGSGGGSCLTPPAPSALVGWASLNGGTTGGGNATPTVVTTLEAFKTAVSGTNAAVVYLNAKLAPASVAIGSNKTIVGVCGAEFHGHLGFSRSANVIVRNLKIVGYGVGDCSKDPAYDSAVGCSSGADAVSVSTASHNIWFDHCDISDGTDGNLDINAGADFITISWTKFHYTARTDNSGNDSTGASGHRFSNLIGSGDDVAEDVGHLNVTWHHNWWAENVNQRMPRTRRGKIHLFNNLFTSTGNSYCTNAGHEAQLLVESNIYSGVNNPLSPDADGSMLERNNLFQNTTGTKVGNGAGFTPTYSYTPEATGSLAAAIQSGAGPH
ncbi:MAG: hypothetical protein QM756_09550 [Polyangiaceae bacterium]